MNPSTDWAFAECVPKLCAGCKRPFANCSCEGWIGSPGDTMFKLFNHGYCWVLANEVAFVHGGQVVENDLHSVAKVDRWYIDVNGVYDSIRDIHCGLPGRKHVVQGHLWRYYPAYFSPSCSRYAERKRSGSLKHISSIAHRLAMEITETLDRLKGKSIGRTSSRNPDRSIRINRKVHGVRTRPGDQREDSRM